MPRSTMWSSIRRRRCACTTPHTVPAQDHGDVFRDSLGEQAVVPDADAVPVAGADDTPAVGDQLGADADFAVVPFDPQAEVAQFAPGLDEDTVAVAFDHDGGLLQQAAAAEFIAVPADAEAAALQSLPIRSS